MQRICRTCKKPIFNLAGNFCCSTCFMKFSEKRYAYLQKLIKAQPNEGKNLNYIMVEELKQTAREVFNPMEVEYAQ